MKQPPAKKRYDEKCPVVSVRVTKELKEILDKYRGDRSYSEVMRLAIQNIEYFYRKVKKEFENKLEEEKQKSYSEGYNKGLEVGKKEGYDKGKQDGYSEGYKFGEIWGYIKGREKEREEMKPKLIRLEKLEEERKQNPLTKAYNILTELEERYMKMLEKVNHKLSFLKNIQTECEIYGVDDEQIKSFIERGLELGKLWLLFDRKLQEAKIMLESINLEKMYNEIIKEKEKKRRTKTIMELLKWEKQIRNFKLNSFEFIKMKVN